MSTIIKIDKVSKAFLRRVILKDVSLSVEAGHTVGIVGSNGSGKSVLFQIICGFLVPDSGIVSVRDQALGNSRDFPENMGVLINSPGFISLDTGLQNLRYSAMWDPQLLEVLRSLSPSSRSIFVVESLKSATRNFEKLLDILEFLLTHDLKFASTNFYIENGHVERRIKPLRAGHTSKEIQKNLSQTAGLGYRHAAALNQL